MPGLRSLVLLVAASICLAALGEDVRAQSGPYEPDHVIVEFRGPTKGSDVDSVLGGNGFIAERCLRDSTTFLVRLPNGWDVQTGIAHIENRPAVEYVGPNYFCRFPESAQMSQAFLDGDSDPFAVGVSPDDYYAQYAVSRLAMPLGHLMSTGTGQVIAQIDNGVDFLHPLLESRLSFDGYDFIDFDSNPTYEIGDYAGHGTFSAGLLALTAPDAVILPIRALSSDGFGTVFGVTLGIDYAIDASVDVLCLGFSLALDDRILRAAIGRAEEAGIITIAPAGNDDRADPFYPAAYTSVIGVAAVDSLDIKAPFSNYGPSVDLCAPGVNVYSALPGGDIWGRWNGTSFAAPMVAGLAGLVHQLHPGAPVAACRRIIAWGSHDIDSLNPAYAGALGEGRIDFANATGQTVPVVAIWGWATDSAGVGHDSVNVNMLQGGVPLSQSAAVTDATGFYTSALPAGTHDIAFIPPTGSGHYATGRAGTALGADAALSVIMPTVARGDINTDGILDVVDVVGLIEYVFRSALPPEPVSLADINCDGTSDVIDVVRLIEHVFRDGAQPSCP
jgi:hypothetical protein